MLSSLLEVNIGDIFVNLYNDMGFVNGTWQNYVMLLISFILMYLAIVKKFEPLLLLPIAKRSPYNSPGQYKQHKP